MTGIAERLRAAYLGACARLAPTLRRWWDNPLFLHARRLRRLPLRLLKYALPSAMFILTLLAVLAWVLHWRMLGAGLMGISLAAALTPLLAAPVAAAGRVAQQMHSPAHDPRSLTDLDPPEVAWGLLLVALWRVRWPALLGLALTPTLIVSLLRLDAASLEAWRGSAQALGAVTAAGRAGEALARGGLPYFRLALWAVSGALLPWAALPLFTTLGVMAALALGDAGLAPLVTLLGEVIAATALVLLWAALSSTPLLAGPYEALRLLALTTLLAGLLALTAPLNRLNARLLGGEAGRSA